MIFLVLTLVAYLLGSIPTGKVVVKRTKGVDIQEYGSGNIGAANVLRVAGPRASGLVLIVDIFKGMLPVLLAKWLRVSPVGQVFIGTAAIIGHIWPVFHGFKGGKGVLTALGSLLAMAPLAALVAIVTGGGVMSKYRYSSLGSLTGTIVGAICLALLIMAGKKPPGYLLHAFISTLLVVATHRENIQRLLAGKENKLASGTAKKRVP
ncbi:MAG: glycerol-3-phosphate 1-O-acyltransferase PlsY [Dehalococcoidia bacterium]